MYEEQPSNYLLYNLFTQLNKGFHKTRNCSILSESIERLRSYNLAICMDEHSKIIKVPFLSFQLQNPPKNQNITLLTVFIINVKYKNTYFSVQHWNNEI